MVAVTQMSEHTAAAAASGASARQRELQSLVRRMAAADDAAMAALYDGTSGVLYALALRITGNAADAEEVLHDVYCRAWRKAATYDESRGSVMSWLVLMTRSTAIDLVRSRRLDEAMMPVSAAAEISDAAERSPEVSAGAAEQAERIRGAMAALPADQRQVVDLAFFGGLTHSEMADRLQLPLGTVKTRLRTALGRLRTLLGGMHA
jgi:RNA polymerase sigma-70 factor, ECF subfamily